MWFHSPVPHYQSKMRAFVDLYVSPAAGEPVLSIDEKSGIQVLSRLRPLAPASPRRDARYDFEYKRRGTRWLFACFNIRTGSVVGRCTLRQFPHARRPGAHDRGVHPTLEPRPSQAVSVDVRRTSAGERVRCV